MPAQIAFAKLNAPHTKDSWSLSYNAGSLFAVISLRQTKEGEETAAEAGKKFISALEAEFFSLEEKSFEKIKTAIDTALSEISRHFTLSAAFAYNKEGYLYVYTIHEGGVLLKRDTSQGMLLTGESESLLGASGVLQTGDVIVLGTKGFFAHVPSDMIKEALSLQLPSDMGETLTPHLVDSGKGEEAALFLTYTGESLAQDAASVPTEEKAPETPPVREAEPFIPSTAALSPAETSTFEPTENATVSSSSAKNFLTHLLRTKFLFIGLAFLVFFLLVGLIYHTKTNQYTNEIKALFNENYPAAQKDFEEGESLLALNKSLARDDYLSAQKRLDSMKDKLKKGSEEETQTVELLAKVNARLSETGDIQKITPKEQAADASILLATYAKESPLSITEDATSLYLLTATSVEKITKSTKTKTTIIENDDGWSEGVSIAFYLSNLYILDEEKGVLKYTPAGSGYAKSSYFQADEAPDQTLTAHTIDGSIWLLGEDGNILKYTKGKRDSFAISGLSKLPTKPTRIHTSVEGTILYVLDNQNSQILLFDKSGKFLSSLQADGLSNAKEFIVNEEDKTILFLSSGKIFSIPLP